MCGIVGYTGGQDSVGILMDGLNALAYRGYDSAGLAVWNGDKIELRKAKGEIANLQKLLDAEPVRGCCGVGHTRWATHGEPSYINSHPHTDGKSRIALVHNGIIENYAKLKSMLTEKGIHFVSETDTEVIAQLLGYLYNGSPLETLRDAMSMLTGSFAIAILFADEPSRIYCASAGSPMVVGLGSGGAYVASDIPAILPYTRDVCFVENRQMAVLNPDRIVFFDEFGVRMQKETTHVDWDVESAKKGKYAHYMMKEICEQPAAFQKTLEQYADLASGTLKSELFPWTAEEAKALTKLRITSCGTAFHAAMLAKKFIEHMAHVPVEAEIASEFRYGDAVLNKGESLLVISQSGETADTIAALRRGREAGMKTFAVCNVIGSTISREVDKVLYTFCGPEIAVAATKSYLMQVLVSYLMALDLAVKRGEMTAEQLKARLLEMQRIPAAIQTILDDRKRIQYFASREFAVRHVFFIGRGIDYALALEAALKLKEISYIHSEAYAAGELKHGTIALIEEGSLVVALATQRDLLPKMG